MWYWTRMLVNVRTCIFQMPVAGFVHEFCTFRLHEFRVPDRAESVATDDRTCMRCQRREATSRSFAGWVATQLGVLRLEHFLPLVCPR